MVIDMLQMLAQVQPTDYCLKLCLYMLYLSDLWVDFDIIQFNDLCNTFLSQYDPPIWRFGELPKIMQSEGNFNPGKKQSSLGLP